MNSARYRFVVTGSQSARRFRRLTGAQAQRRRGRPRRDGDARRVPV